MTGHNQDLTVEARLLPLQYWFGYELSNVLHRIDRDVTLRMGHRACKKALESLAEIPAAESAWKDLLLVFGRIGWISWEDFREERNA